MKQVRKVYRYCSGTIQLTLYIWQSPSYMYKILGLRYYLPHTNNDTVKKCYVPKMLRYPPASRWDDVRWAPVVHSHARSSCPHHTASPCPLHKRYIFSCEHRGSVAEPERNFLAVAEPEPQFTVITELSGIGSGTIIIYGSGTVISQRQYKIVYSISCILTFLHSHFTINLMKLINFFLVKKLTMKKGKIFS